MAKAPCRRGRTVATASCGDAPPSTSRATRWATTSVSVSLLNLRPSAISSSRSGLKFSMMPLWTIATGPTMCGWALSTVGAPWVAQRVWAMPIVPPSGSRRQLAREIVELAFGAAAGELAMVDRADAGAVIAAIFEALEPIEQPLRDFSFCRQFQQFRTCRAGLNYSV